MKIIVVCFSLGGVMKSFFTSITRQMAQANDVFVVTNNGISESDVFTRNILNVKFDRNCYWDFINLYSFYKIKRYIKSIDYDVAFVVNQHPVNNVVYRYLDKSKTVTYVHDILPHSGIEMNLKAILAKRFFKSDWFDQSAKVVLSSYNSLEIACNIYHDRSKFVVNYLGLLDDMLFDLPEMEQDIDVLFFGRIEYYKGIDMLIEAAKQLVDYKFYIVGKGNLHEIYGIKQLPDNCYRISNYVPNRELALLIKRCKVVVLPYKDATGTQTIQIAFFYSRPVLATSVGCFPEYISNGEDGLIVPSGDLKSLVEGLNFLLKNDGVRLKMGQKGAQNVEKQFSNSSINQKYMDIFSSLV